MPGNEVSEVCSDEVRRLFLFPDNFRKVVISLKRTNPLWGSIGTLTGVVIAILALLKGPWATAALIVTFTLWGLWLIYTQLLPAWSSNREYRRRARQSRSRQEGALSDDGGSVSVVLLRHVNHRISEHLRSVYPDAHWEWTMSDPALFVAHGGTGRIRVYGIPDYDFADVTLDRQGSLRCSLVKVAPLDGSQAASPNQQPLDPQVWYEFQGRTVLEDVIADLRSRGHSSLTMNEDGSICIQPVDGGEEIAKESFPAFPEKVYWPRLVKVLEQEGLAADVQDTRILVSW